MAVAAAPTVHFSEKNLCSVVFNLLSNALKYRDPNRELQVRLHSRPEGEGVVLAVQDNGLGLDAANEHRLFCMFQRFHGHVEDTGIGLYMVKKNGGECEQPHHRAIGSGRGLHVFGVFPSLSGLRLPLIRPKFTHAVAPG